MRSSSGGKARSNKYAGLLLMVDPSLTASEQYLWAPPAGFRQGRRITVAPAKGTPHDAELRHASNNGAETTPSEVLPPQPSPPRTPPAAMPVELLSLLAEKTEAILSEPSLVELTPLAGNSKVATGFRGTYSHRKSTTKVRAGPTAGGHWDEAVFDANAGIWVAAPIPSDPAAASPRYQLHGMYAYDQSFDNWRSPPQSTALAKDTPASGVPAPGAQLAAEASETGVLASVAEDGSEPLLPDIQALVSGSTTQGGTRPQQSKVCTENNKSSSKAGARPPSTRSQWTSNVMQLMEESSVHGWSDGEDGPNEGSTQDLGLELLKLASDAGAAAGRQPV
eukprot:jgi/Tetstr1/424353/TSEL_014915.t1